MTVEDLPSPLAWACARAAPSERPPPERIREAVVALVELACLRMLAEVAGRPESLPFTVESALRLTLLEPVAADGWVDLYASLAHSGLADLLGWPAVPDSQPVADWLEHAVAEPGPDTVAAVAGLARAAKGLPAPWLLLRGSGGEVEGRRLVGTAWPPIVRVPGPEPAAPGLYFWDERGAPLPIPAWLARWDDTIGALRITGGRDGRRYLWRSAARPADVESTLEPPPGLPPFLREPTFGTPAGVERSDPNALTRAIPRVEKRGETSRMVARVAAPAPSSPTPSVPGAVLALRVVAGPDLLRWMEVRPGEPLVLGRQGESASFPLHHHQVSRLHARVGLEGQEVWVEDLGSTNGTQIYSPVPGLPPRTLRIERAGVAPGDTIGVGPVLLRLEWLGRERVARLEAIARLRDDEERRDPSTLLLRPQALKDALPEALRATFRDGGAPTPGQPTLHGLLCYVDRLAAIHAQFGEKTADRAFRDVARVLQYEVDDALDGPLASAAESLVRVGYGEILVPAIGLSEGAVLAEGERLVGIVAAHPFEVPIERLTLTAALVEKRPEESAAEWLKRCRRILQDGRSRHGRSRVYR